MRLRFAAVIAWAALIFIGSSFPNPPGATGGEWQYNLAHMTEYAVLGVLVVLALRSVWPTRPLGLLAVAAWLICVAYGMSDELHQSFVPNRDANWMDVGFDSLGAGVALVAVALQNRFK